MAIADGRQSFGVIFYDQRHLVAARDGEVRIFRVHENQKFNGPLEVKRRSKEEVSKRKISKLIQSNRVSRGKRSEAIE